MVLPCFDSSYCSPSAASSRRCPRRIPRNRPGFSSKSTHARSSCAWRIERLEERAGDRRRGPAAARRGAPGRSRRRGARRRSRTRRTQDGRERAIRLASDSSGRRSAERLSASREKCQCRARSCRVAFRTGGAVPQAEGSPPHPRARVRVKLATPMVSWRPTGPSSTSTSRPRRCSAAASPRPERSLPEELPVLLHDGRPRRKRVDLRRDADEHRDPRAAAGAQSSVSPGSTREAASLGHRPAALRLLRRARRRCRIFWAEGGSGG